MTSLLARLIAFLARVASGPKVRVVGESVCRKQCIFYANHSSHLDVVVIWAVLRGRARSRRRIEALLEEARQAGRREAEKVDAS